MTVVLDAVAARQGDCLVLRSGAPGHTATWLVDGGPPGTYRAALAPWLAGLRAKSELPDTKPFPLELVVISHVDGDHVGGAIELLADVVDAEMKQRARPWRVGRLWHNSFDVMAAAPLPAAITAAIPRDLDRLAAGAQGVAGVAGQVASINQGGRLADLARRLGLDGNPPVGGLVTAPRTLTVDGVATTVLTPSVSRVEALADTWEAKVGQAIDRGALADAAAYVDRSVTNLSSIAVHLAVEGTTLLLAGDARGDDLVGGLDAAGLLVNGVCRVDLLKVPHHGSDRTLTKAFFEQVVADHYVISADGKHDNPSGSTLAWIVETQGTRDYEIHLTYGDANGATALLESLKVAGRRYVVRSRAPAGKALSVVLVP